MARSGETPDLIDLMVPFFRKSDNDLRLTAYNIAVLKLLEQFTAVGPTAKYIFSSGEKNRISVGFLQLIRHDMLPIYMLKQMVYREFDSSSMAVEFERLTKQATAITIDTFIANLDSCFNVFFTEGQTFVRRNSIVGCFVRKMYITYHKRSYPELCQLRHDYRKYFKAEQDSPLLQRKIPLMEVSESSSSDSVGMEITLDMTPCVDTSNDTSLQDETFLDDMNCTSLFQQENGAIKEECVPSRKEALSYIIKQMISFKNDQSNEVSCGEVDAWISETRRHLPDLHELYFLEYLNALRKRDLQEAQDALYHYFDCIGLTLMNKNILDVYSGRLAGPGDAIISINSFRSLRYAPLLLAELHYKFGNDGQAIEFIQECLRNAREANDKLCLDYAVSLLYLLDDESTRLERHRLMDQALKDTDEHNHIALHLRSHLAKLFHQIRRCTDSKSIAEASRLILLEIHEKCFLDKMNGAQSSWTVRTIVDITLSSLYLQRGCWDAAGFMAQKVLQFTTKSCQVHSIAVANLSYSLIARGFYATAKALVTSYQTKFYVRGREYERLLLAEAIIDYEMSFIKGDIEKCGKLLLQLEALSPAEGGLRRVLYYTACSRPKLAIPLLLKFIETSSVPYMQCRSLFLLGRIYLHSSNIGTAKVYFEKCSELAEQCQIRQLAILSKFCLLEVSANLGMCVNKQIMDADATDGELWCLTRLDMVYLYLLKARILLYWKENLTDYTKRALEHLEAARKLCSPINAYAYLRQVYALMAIAFSRLSRIEDCNRYSKLYRQLGESLQKKGFAAIIF